MTEAHGTRDASTDEGTHRHPTGPDEAFRRENLGRLLIRAFNAFEDYHLRRLREEGFADFTGSETAVLRNVESGGSRITDIARRTNVTPQAISQLVAGLERKGYLTNAPDPTDGRARLVRLTDRGLALIARGQEITGELHERWAEILGAEALGELQRLLAHLVSGLGLDDEGLG